MHCSDLWPILSETKTTMATLTEKLLRGCMFWVIKIINILEIGHGYLIPTGLFTTLMYKLSGDRQQAAQSHSIFLYRVTYAKLFFFLVSTLSFLFSFIILKLVVRFEYVSKEECVFYRLPRCWNVAIRRIAWSTFFAFVFWFPSFINLIHFYDELSNVTLEGLWNGRMQKKKKTNSIIHFKKKFKFKTLNILYHYKFFVFFEWFDFILTHTACRISNTCWPISLSHTGVVSGLERCSL